MSSKDYNVSVTVYRTSLTFFFYITFRDRDLVNNLKRFITLYNLVLETTYMISFLFYLFLTYQVTFKSKEPVTVRIRNII